MYSQDDYHHHLKDKKVNGSFASTLNLQIIHQAAVKAEYLTGDSHWDTFLSYIQSAIEDARVQELNDFDMISGPPIVDQNILLKAKIALAECQGSIKAWERVMALPNQLIEMGDTAKDLLEG